MDAIRNLDYIDWHSIEGDEESTDEMATMDKDEEKKKTETKKKKKIKGKLEMTPCSEEMVKDFCEKIGCYYEYNKQTNTFESRPVSEWKMKCPIRQQLQPLSGGESGDRCGVYQAILFARDKESLSVLDYWKQGRSELHRELQQHIGSRQVLKWIDQDLIEEHIDPIVNELIRNLAYMKPLYGADTLGSIMHPNQVCFHKILTYTYIYIIIIIIIIIILLKGDGHVWNLTALDSVLNLMDSPIEGVNYPYLYFGRWRALFSWHIEDKGLYSINMLHFGKVFFFVHTPFFFFFGYPKSTLSVVNCLQLIKL
ncbi:jumonji domain containing protein [Reticulomyxa filosa]|uniref:Jumonji domain containing protein n=1 Tax=Reticulomyxa filosa TaxID=46433 RepID=X6M8M4_RETFI|nr:jumonji domain containing protein [Reticulomyxa filosa]|eukprot:ETO10264.1 jumonji domain containing protein [Reticulomyxa filosa]